MTDREGEALDLCREFLAILNLSLRACEAGMTPPVPVAIQNADAGAYMLRLPVRDIHHAMLLKQAAALHYLHAAITLCDADLFVAQGAMQRMADEASDDVCFLASGIIEGPKPLHEKFLLAFWSDHDEDCGDTSAVNKPSSVKREKIHAALNASSDDPYRAGVIAKRLHMTYSGFVHAASANVMDLYDGGRHTFAVDGGPEYHRESHVHDVWNYCYRAGLAFQASARALGSDRLYSRIEEAIVWFQRLSRRDGGYRAAESR